jgi:hypothetical protein
MVRWGGVIAPESGEGEDGCKGGQGVRPGRGPAVGRDRLIIVLPPWCLPARVG